MRSALYEGSVAHTRHTPREHRFRNRLFLVYLDLEELPRVFRGRWLWSVGRWNVASFRRSDYLGDPAVPLDEAVRERVHEALGERPDGPVRVLTHLRYMGYVFNPVSFYYVFAADGETLHSIVAEITNTPWGERHAYVLDARGTPDGASARFAKEFHVSPFFGMDQHYSWSLDRPGEQLGVRMENRQAGEVVLDVALALRRRELTGWSLARALVRFPLLTPRVHLAIYWQALRLWFKRAPFHTHPKKLAPPPTQTLGTHR